MQRKNGFLIKNISSRSGMAMIMAISVIVIVATIMTLSLSLTTLTSKRTTDIYLYEQVALYSKSAAELAIYDIAQNGSCTTVFPSVSANIPSDYNVSITAKYIYTSNICSTGDTFTTISTPEQNGSVVMDIRVSTNAGTEPITYFRRTIQKL